MKAFSRKQLQYSASLLLGLVIILFLFNLERDPKGFIYPLIIFPVGGAALLISTISLFKITSEVKMKYRSDMERKIGGLIIGLLLLIGLLSSLSIIIYVGSEIAQSGIFDQPNLFGLLFLLYSFGPGVIAGVVGGVLFGKSLGRIYL